jgi:hypothetical protein
LQSERLRRGQHTRQDRDAVKEEAARKKAELADQEVEAKAASRQGGNQRGNNKERGRARGRGHERSQDNHGESKNTGFKW